MVSTKMTWRQWLLQEILADVGLSMSNRIKVLFVSHDAGMYGAQKCLLDLLEGLDRNLIEPYLVCHDTGPLTDRCTTLGIPVFVKPLHHWALSGTNRNKSYFYLASSVVRGLRARVWEIAALAERINVDAIYTNTVTVLEGALAARITHKPHIWHLHEVVSGNPELKSLLPQRILNWAVTALSDVRIVNSNFNKCIYGIKHLEPRNMLVYNGIDTQIFNPSNRRDISVATKLTLPTDRKCVIVVGAIHPRKGMDVLLAAARLLHDIHPEIHFLIVGGGERVFIEQFKVQVNISQLDTHFHFLGWVENLPSLIASADLLVSAARQESFGLTVAEAMASGTPVVATRSGGPQEIIEHMQSGILVPVDDPEGLAQAIVCILDDPNLARRLSENGVRRVNEEFTLENYVSSIQEGILQSVKSYTANHPQT